MYSSDKMTQSRPDTSDQRVQLYDSPCAICGEIMLQTTPDDPENRGICYSCYEEMWGRQVKRAMPSVIKVAAAVAGCK